MWSVECGVCSVECGVWSAECVVRSAECVVGSGQWAVGSGQWEVHHHHPVLPRLLFPTPHPTTQVRYVVRSLPDNEIIEDSGKKPVHFVQGSRQVLPCIDEAVLQAIRSEPKPPTGLHTPKTTSSPTAQGAPLTRAVNKHPHKKQTCTADEG